MLVFRSAYIYTHSSVFVLSLAFTLSQHLKRCLGSLFIIQRFFSTTTLAVIRG